MLKSINVLFCALVFVAALISNVRADSFGPTSSFPQLTLSGPLIFSGPSPSVANCGAGATILTGSTDQRGVITEGTLATGCQIILAGTYSTLPFSCVVTAFTAVNMGAQPTISGSTVTLTIVNASLSGTQASYICLW